MVSWHPPTARIRREEQAGQVGGVHHARPKWISHSLEVDAHGSKHVTKPGHRLLLTRSTVVADGWAAVGGDTLPGSPAVLGDDRSCGLLRGRVLPLWERRAYGMVEKKKSSLCVHGYFITLCALINRTS